MTIETIAVQVPSQLQSLDNQEFEDTTWKTKHAIGGLVISEIYTWFSYFQTNSFFCNIGLR